jgi:hypothetical protein
MAGFDGVRLTVNGSAVIDGNGWGGLHARVGSTIVITGNSNITNNGADTTSSGFLFPRFRAGVSASAGSVLSVAAAGGTPLIMGNSGPGILLDLASIGRLFGMTVEQNIEEGFLGRNNSTAEFVPEFGPQNALSGNGSGDLKCDNTTVLVGDFGGAQVINCASAGGGGPPN